MGTEKSYPSQAKPVGWQYLNNDEIQELTSLEGFLLDDIRFFYTPVNTTVIRFSKINQSGNVTYRMLKLFNVIFINVKKMKTEIKITVYPFPVDNFGNMVTKIILNDADNDFYIVASSGYLSLVDFDFNDDEEIFLNGLKSHIEQLL